ncbi:MAG: TonB-dependent receptor [Massilia sp.]
MGKRSNKEVVFHRRYGGTALAVASLFIGNAAWAQQSAPSAVATQAEPAVVVISGTRASVASAIDRKKGASTVSDSIVAEDIGQFPDKNVGEALSRITGVQLTRDFGEGTQVSIRGVEPNLNRIEINGLSVLSSNGTAGRGAELRELPAELIKSIDVIKGVTADITEGGIGGSVLIKTNKPFDFKKFTFAATASGEQASSRGGLQPRGSVLVANRFLGGDLGVMLNVVYDNVLTQNDFVRNSSWRFIRDWDFSAEKTTTSLNKNAAAVTTPGGCAALTVAADKTACDRQWFDYSPGIPRYGIWTRDHKRSSAELTAQYKVNSDLNVFASYQRNKQDQQLNDRNFGTDFPDALRLSGPGIMPTYGPTGVPTGTAATCTPVSTTSTPAGMVVTNHQVTEYVVGNCIAVAGQGGYNAFSTAARDFNLRVDSEYTSGGFFYRKGDFDIEGLLVKSTSNYANDTNNVVLTQNVPGMKVTLDKDGYPHFTFPAAYDPEKSSSYTRAEVQYRPTETDNSEDQVKLDLKYRMKTPFFTKFYTGLQGRRTSSSQYNGGGYLASAGSDLVSTADDINVRSANVTNVKIYDPLYTGGAQRPNDVQTFINSNNTTQYISSAQMVALVDAARTRSAGTFLNGYNEISGFPSNWIAPSFAAAAPSFDTSKFNHDLIRNSIGSDGKSYPQIPAFIVDEQIRSTYLRLDFEQPFMGLTFEGNIGARYTYTKDTGTGANIRRDRAKRNGSAVATDVTVSNSILTMNNSYHDLLPSFNLASWVIPDTLVARIGWGKVMSRPLISQLVPAVNCLTGSGNPANGGDGSADDCTATGNPKLEPYRATNKDISVEWYPSKDSMVSLAWFRKDIGSYIQPAVLYKNVDYYGDGALYDLTMPANAQGATTKGFELAGRTALTFLPGFLSGFGLDTNYTRMSYSYAPGNELINAIDGSVLSYPGLSKNSYNVGIWYDLDKINARLAYNYRDAYNTGNTDANTGNAIFGEKVGFLDAKIQYRYNAHLTFSIEAKNLTDQAQVLTAGAASRPNELGWSGRRYFVGLSYKN